MVPQKHRKKRIKEDLEMDQPDPKKHCIESNVSAYKYHRL